MVKIKSFDAILHAIFKEQNIAPSKAALSDELLRIYKSVGEVEISGSYRFLSYKNAEEMNRILHEDFEELETKFWPFAETGTGDTWFLNLECTNSKSGVFFYDHDLEEYSRENMLDMEIGLKQWFQLADLTKQVYEKNEHLELDFSLKSEVKEIFIKQMEKINLGLSKIYPYKI